MGLWGLLSLSPEDLRTDVFKIHVLRIDENCYSFVNAALFFFGKKKSGSTAITAEPEIKSRSVKRKQFAFRGVWAGFGFGFYEIQSRLA